MKKTKKELELDLRIMTECYKKTHEEMMAYYFVLTALATRCFRVAEFNLKEIKEKRYFITESQENYVEKLNKLINEIKEKRG